ncbi:reverse transcriptase domain-containing protein [Tanacetum coccineum]
MRTRSQSREPRPPPPEGPPVVIEPLRIEYPFQEDPIVEPMADTRTMAQLLQAPTDGQGRQTRAKAVVAKVSTNSSTQAVSSDVAELKDIVRALLLDKKNQASAPAPAPAPVKAVELICVTSAAANYNQASSIFRSSNGFKSILTIQHYFRVSGTLPVVKPIPEVTKDQVHPSCSQSTAPVQPPVGPEPITTPVLEPIVAPVPNTKPSVFLPYPSRRDNEKSHNQANEQIEKFYEIFKEMSFEISFADALILMPKFALTLKALLGNKEKLTEMARTSLNEHCSAVILNKLPRKLGDSAKFLIPCEFPGMDECLVLADLGASINLMPFLVWEKLSLPDLTPTCMTLELADRSISKPMGIAKDIFL